MAAKLVGFESWEEAEEAHGDIHIAVERAPVSSQASGPARAAFVECIRELTGRCPFVITSDVTVDIQWFVSEEERYESDAAADVDNIIKPVLDALSGPRGLIVNDCQVQAVTAYWVGAVELGQQLSVRLHSPFGDFRFPKATLQFAQLGRALCFPLDAGESRGLQLRFLRQIERMVLARDAMLDGPPGIGRAMLPLQRLFHRTRVAGFPVLLLADLYRALEEA
jgi:Holliday junction resolvase RusA-like endonuclease